MPSSGKWGDSLLAVKISVIGAGNVGATLAQRLAEEDLGDVVLLDVVEGVPQGKALDIQQSAVIVGFRGSITGTNSYRHTAGSDVVIITAGASRQPGMSRDDLLKGNARIINEVVANVVRFSPEAIIVMVTNPVDAMTYLALKLSRFPRHRVLGLSGVLDSARLASLIAAELKVPVAAVSALVLGEHGQNMVVLPRLSTVRGKPLTDMLPPEAVDGLVARTVSGGLEIVRLLKAGSAFYAPSAAAARMVAAIIGDKQEVLPCAAYLDGEYGLRNTVIGVPVRLGGKGIEQIVELELTPGEQKALTASANAAGKLIEAIKPD
jgi:malate dehydrogenase